MAKNKADAASRAVDRKIERIYGAHCSGMQLDMMRIPTLFAQARVKLAAGITDEQLGQWMIEFVNNV